MPQIRRHPVLLVSDEFMCVVRRGSCGECVGLPDTFLHRSRSAGAGTGFWSCYTVLRLRLLLGKTSRRKRHHRVRLFLPLTRRYPEAPESPYMTRLISRTCISFLPIGTSSRFTTRCRRSRLHEAVRQHERLRQKFGWFLRSLPFN